MGYTWLPLMAIDGRDGNCANSNNQTRGPVVGHGCGYEVGDMTQITSLLKLRVPVGGQEIELQQVEFDAGSMNLLRTRIREKSRFTIFDVDPQTAMVWGAALLNWAQEQGQGIQTP